MVGPAQYMGLLLLYMCTAAKEALLSFEYGEYTSASRLYATRVHTKLPIYSS